MLSKRAPPIHIVFQLMFENGLQVSALVAQFSSTQLNSQLNSFLSIDLTTFSNRADGEIAHGAQSSHDRPTQQKQIQMKYEECVYI